MKLYNHYASSASFRVRIALNLKGLSYEYESVRLAWKASGVDRPEYRALNPQARVPTLHDGDLTMGQSLAIFDYLDRQYPDPVLFPGDAAGRARVWSLSLFVACDIQPLANLTVERYLVNTLHADKDAVRAWRRHWITVGLDGLEQELVRSSATGRYCHGDTPTAADCCLVPQVFNALRPNVGLELETWPTIARVFHTCGENPAFVAAFPKNQPDFEEPTLR